MNSYWTQVGKRPLIVGYSTTGKSIAQHWDAQQIPYWVYDDALSGSEFAVDEDFLYTHTEEISVVMRSPGVPRTHRILQRMCEQDVPLCTDFDVAAGYLEGKQVIVVTGTDGKSTTVTFLQQLLEQEGQSVVSCGNNGIPILTKIPEIKKSKYVVIELSSFMLEEKLPIKAAGLIITNVSPDHMDRYENFESYVSTKKRSFTLLGSQSVYVRNGDDPHLQEKPQIGKTITISAQSANKSKVDWLIVFEAGEVSFIQDSKNVFVPAREDKIRSVLEPPKMQDHKDKPKTGELNKLHYVHTREGKLRDIEVTGEWTYGNRYNLGQAMACLDGLGICMDQIDFGKIKTLGHRMEWVPTHKNVMVYNDSKSTTIGALLSALHSCPNKGEIHIILGGKAKGQSFYGLPRQWNQQGSKTIYITGKNSEKIRRELEYTKVLVEPDFTKCIELAWSRLQMGDILLFSPACASERPFANYEERGARFVEILRKLDQDFSKNKTIDVF